MGTFTGDVFMMLWKNSGLKSLTTWALMIECPVSTRHPSKRGELKSPPTPLYKEKI